MSVVYGSRQTFFLPEKKTYEGPPTRLLDKPLYIRLQLLQLLNDSSATLFRLVTVQYDMPFIGEIVITATTARVARFVDSERFGVCRSMCERNVDSGLLISKRIARNYDKSIQRNRFYICFENVK